MRSPRVWLGIAISLIFLYFAFRGQDFGEIWESLRRANYWYVVPGLLLYFMGVWVRSVRWSLLLRPMCDASGKDLFPVVTIGYTANNVLPLRAGEFVRAYVLSNRLGVRKSSGLATIAIERLFDGLTMLGFILIASLSIGLTAQLRHVILVAVLLFAGLLTGLLLVTTRHMSEWLTVVLIPRIPGRPGVSVGRMANSFLTGLGTLRRRQDLVLVILTSITAWLLEASMYALVSEGFGLGLSPAAVLLVTAVANLATLIPSSPGYVGPFEAGVLLALVGAVGIQRELALSYAIAVHAALYFPITILGLFYWWRESLSWRQIRSLSTDEAST